ncbi:TPA: restriction endonuclease subunit S [Streptococcus suis]|nr:restriction endonuclease subunit S [Streptococcus suis]
MPNKDKNIPKRRFKAFENADAWELRKLKLLFIFKYGDGNNNPSNGGPYPVFGAGGVQGGYTEYNSENSIIIGHMGDAGCVSWGEGKHFVTYNGTITRPKEEVFTAKFGYYLLSKMNLRQYRGGSGLPFLTYDMLNDMDTIVPTNKSECDKISEFFSTLDQQITLHQRKLDKLKNVKQAYLSEMFPAEGERVPKRRFPGFTDAWELRKLRNIFHNIENAFVGIVTPHYVSDGRFYLESNNIKDGQVNYETKVFISEEFYQRQKNKWLRAGDIVMVQSGHVGHSAVIPEELDCSAAHALIMFRKQKVKISSNFLNYQFQTKQSKKKLDLITTGNTIKHILSSEMKEFNAYFPSLPEQSAIGTFFSTLDRQITLHQRKLEKLKNLKKALLNELFV